MDQGKVVDVIHLHFSKAFDSVFHSIPLQKLAAHGLDRSSLFAVQKTGRMARPREWW